VTNELEVRSKDPIVLLAKSRLQANSALADTEDDTSVKNGIEFFGSHYP
jgi:hypothetical protein